MDYDFVETTWEAREYNSWLRAWKEIAHYNNASEEDKQRFDRLVETLGINYVNVQKYIRDKQPDEFTKIRKRAEEIKREKERRDQGEKTIKDENKIINSIFLLLASSKTRQSGIYELAEFCLKKFDIITFQDSDEIFIYSKGIYNPNGEKFLSSFVQKKLKLDNLITKHIINELHGYIRRSTYKKRDEITESKDKICLKNGILDLKTLEVIPHSSDIIFFNRIPVNYNSKAICPKIKKFLGEVVSQEDVKILQEFSGYCLYKGYHIHKAFMLVGGGANGKSTFINLLRLFLGQQNCSSVPLQNLENNRFAVSSLFGKLVNMFADLPSKALKETSLFKLLTTEDLVSGEKKFKDQFFFTNYAKLIFSCNQIPRSPDDSDAFFRRWIIINFPNQFLGDRADKKLIKKITTPEELSGFLNFALEGLKRLLEQGEFNNTGGIDEVREEYIRQSDSVGAFNMDYILISPEEYVQKKELYTTYCDYCRSNKYPIVPENTFHRHLQEKIRVEDYRPSIDGRRVQCWRGIKVDVSEVKDVKEDPHLNSENQTKLNIK